MAALLTQAWLDRRLAAGTEAPARPGASARLRHVVSGGPDGEVAYLEAYEDGRLVAAELDAGADGDAEVVCSETYADAVQIASGALDLHVAFMQGRVKVAGDVGALMRVLPVVHSAAHRAGLASLAEGA